MAKNKGTKFVVMEGFVRWPKLTYEKRDTHEGHVGTTGGKYTIDFYPLNEEELQKYWDAGCAKTVMGNVMLREPGHKSWKDKYEGEDAWMNDDPDLGIGKYLKF